MKENDYDLSDYDPNEKCIGNREAVAALLVSVSLFALIIIL